MGWCRQVQDVLHLCYINTNYFKGSRVSVFTVNGENCFFPGRSNGFEKKRYERMADKRAAQEVAYKWSVEDM